MHKFTDDIEFFSILFDAIPAVTLIVNEEARVKAINSATKDFLNVTEKEACLMKGGKVFPALTLLMILKHVVQQRHVKNAL